jgi:hypothetical protein
MVALGGGGAFATGGDAEVVFVGAGRGYGRGEFGFIADCRLKSCGGLRLSINAVGFLVEGLDGLLAVLVHVDLGWGDLAVEEG